MFHLENKKSVFAQKKLPPSAEKREKCNNCYVGRRLPVLHSCLEINGGETIAVVEPSGSGKSISPVRPVLDLKYLTR